MGECMNYPEKPMDFIKSYSFTDRREVYTNGSELVPVFRVEQVVEHYMPRWIPVTERLPSIEDIRQNKCAYFLTTEKYQSTAQRRIYNIISGEFKDMTDRKVEVVAWMPLPKIKNP